MKRLPFLFILSTAILAACAPAPTLPPTAPAVTPAASATPIDLPRPRDLNLLQQEHFAEIAGKIRQAIVVA